MDKNVIIVCGPLCSGKTTFAKTLVNHRHIDIGDIVREIKQKIERVHDAMLDTLINGRLTHEMARQDVNTNIVITGIRQKSIYDHVISNCELFKQTHETLWLDVPKDILFQRFLNRDEEKDKNPLKLTLLDSRSRFNDLLIADAYLGLRELKDYLLTQTTTKVIKNYDTDTV